MGKDPNRIAPRITHDELKAAESAFQGRPFNEAWSQAARTVYVGILVAKIKLNHERSMLGLPAPKRDLQRAEELVGMAVCSGDGEGFNGL